tara:strand:+ start:46 stop:210 length:165 start_codon:yes stop_codon:yes gene_type:complete
MNTPREKLPEPKINILKIVKLNEKEKKTKDEKPCKYLDQLYKNNDKFLKKYFEE